MAVNLLDNMRSFGNGVIASAQALVTWKTYHKFANLSKSSKIEVVAQTVLVAFAAGILGSVLASQFALTAVVGGALAFGDAVPRPIPYGLPQPLFYLIGMNRRVQPQTQHTKPNLPTN